MNPPPVGSYWKRAEPKKDFPLETMRRGATNRFDNARLTKIEGAKHYYGPLIRPEYEFLMQDPGIGDPPLAEHKGYVVTSASIEYAAMASQFLPHFHRGSVLEIGGGYGGLAYAVLSARGDCDYTIVDLPMVGRCSKYYLGEFADRTTVLTPEEFAGEGRKYDLVIQTRGFMEMDPAEVAWYLVMIQEYVTDPGALFFTINRKKKISKFRQYPFDRKWQVLLKDRWPESGGMPMMLLRRTEEGSPELRGAIEELCR